MYDLLFELFILTLATFAISSIWLYTPLLEDVRNKIASFQGHKNWLLNKISYLGICQICIGTWIALAIESQIMVCNNIFFYIIFALIASSGAWAIGAFVTAALWIKAICEDVIRKSEI